MELLSNSTAEYFIMLKVFVDESGTHNPNGEVSGSEVPVLSGYMGRLDDWRKFERDWKIVLDRHGVSDFHAKDFEGRFDPYLSWPENQRESFRYALAEIAGRNIPVGGSYHIKQHRKDHPNDETYPYTFAIANFFKDMLDALQEWKLLSEEISIVFDSTTNKKWMGEIARQIDVLKRIGVNICDHNYGDDKVYTPIQSADMLAHRSRQRHFEKLERQIATGKSFFLPSSVYDIVLHRNLHPKIGFRPKMTAEEKKIVQETARKFKSVRRALKEVPHNYFNVK